MPDAQLGVRHEAPVGFEALDSVLVDFEATGWKVSCWVWREEWLERANVMVVTISRILCS